MRQGPVMDRDIEQATLELDHDEVVTVMDETIRWRARDASVISGKWKALLKRIPRFSIEEFKATQDGPANPHIRTVVRMPVAVTEQKIPVGTVSNTYHLAQHVDVVDKCLQAIRAHQIDPDTLHCEVALTELGEWMHFRAYFPESFSYKPGDGQTLRLRLECFNSVDGSSRLVILFGWFRLVCSNGLIIGETKAALRDVHDERLDLTVIPKIVSEGLQKVKADLARLKHWEKHSIEQATFESWIDNHLASRWGKKAACRTLHICRNGIDVELLDPFEGGNPSEKQVKPQTEVPGAAKPAKNLYDVCQALSWIATKRNSADERLEWQGHIPDLIENLRGQMHGVPQ